MAYLIMFSGTFVILLAILIYIIGALYTNYKYNKRGEKRPERVWWR